MQIRQQIAVIVICVIAISACKSNAQYGILTPTTQPNMTTLKDILSQCSAPCWYGVEPGVTNRVDAERLLSSVYGQDSIDQSRDSGFVWNKPQDHVQGIVTFTMKTVETVTVFFDDNRFTVGQLIDAIGEPEYIIIHYGGVNNSYCRGFKLMFAHTRVTADIWLSQQKGIDALQSISTLNLVQNELFIAPRNFGGADWAVEWEGYKDYCALRP